MRTFVKSTVQCHIFNLRPDFIAMLLITIEEREEGGKRKVLLGIQFSWWQFLEVTRNLKQLDAVNRMQRSNYRNSARL